MCGIFGVISKENLNLSPDLLQSMIDYLFKLSESRGKEAAGLAIRSNKAIYVYKGPHSASRMICSSEYRQMFNDVLTNDVFSKESNGLGNNLAIIGHSRLATNGAQTLNDNNQPVIKDGIVGIHNGIIVNHKDLWKKFPSLKREYEVDTEVILSLIRMFLKGKKSLVGAVQNTFKLIEGSASIATLFKDINYLILATNTGSLYVCVSGDGNVLAFASELYILKTFFKKRRFRNLFGQGKISQVKPGFGYLVNLADLKMQEFSLKGKETLSLEKEDSSLINLNIIDLSSQNEQKTNNFKELGNFEIKKQDIFKDFYSEILPSVMSLKRCTKCVLPETMPFIEFDERGVCNYCKSYKKIELKDKSILEEIIGKYKNKGGGPDCIFSFSGGRDSSYGLHYIKTVLKMNPIAYSYDWGMITDLGRRNQARLCGKLGVEHILVSADIGRKRENIRKNVKAWLKKPDLGMIPLFMAGDKQYFYYANKLTKQTGVKLITMCENILERTHFKHGFCGIQHKVTDKPPYFLSLADKTKLAAYYTKQFIVNPSYINSSILDTLTGYISYYLIPHNYLYLYDFIKWSEKEIISTLIKEYDWEVAEDTKTTWRIGDGTAAFYNYIYYVVAGFTENDTFRSNQIREGMISREEALKLVEEDNGPRYDSIRWYCDTIGIDFEETLKIINSIPRLYNERQRKI